MYRFTLLFLLLAGSASAQLDPALTQAPQYAEAMEVDIPALQARGVSESDLAWRWAGDPRWMGGRDVSGGETFFGSVIRGRKFAGSTIGPEGDVAVRIEFSSSERTRVQTFRRDLGYASAGVGEFPGAAYDISDPDNPRRLNIAIVEDARYGEPNLTWDPDGSSSGKREYVFIMASDYDETGKTYAGKDIIADAPTLDILYFWWPQLRSGYSLLEADPSALDILLADITDFSVEPDNEQVTLSWNYDPPAEAEELVLYYGLTSPAADPLAILDVDDKTFTSPALDPDVKYYFRAEARSGDGDVIDLSAEVRTRALVSRNVSLEAKLDPASSYGDVWGYVDPATGREYALLCARFQGLYVIDVTDPMPVQVGFVPGTDDDDADLDAEDSKDVKTYGTYAYLVNENAPIQIIDLSDPTDPVQVGTLDTDANDGEGEGNPDRDDGGSHNILVEEGYLYVVGGRSPGGLRIYDLANPAAPLFVGDFQPTYYHDIEVRNDTVYAAAIYNDGVDIIDVSNKAAPELISNFIYAANYMGAHNVCSTEDGAYVFVGDEIGTGSYTRVFDVRDPRDVDQVAEIIVDRDAPVHNCYVEGDLLYIAHYTEGAYVYDIRDPENPVEVGIYDTYLGQDSGFLGTWTVYPYLPSGKLLASDVQSGLYVLDFDERAVAAEEPESTPEAPFALGASYPNPTTGATTIPFTLPEEAHVRIVLYDVLGREVAVLADETADAGPQSVSFDGSLLPAGAYFYRLEADGLGASASHSLTVVR